MTLCHKATQKSVVVMLLDIMTENVLEYSVEQTLNAQVTRREKKLQLMDLASRN